MGVRYTTGTSFRFDAETLVRMDAWTVYLSARDGRRWTRAELVRSLIDRQTPPSDLTPEAMALREAYR